jgi:hypothetical protein
MRIATIALAMTALAPMTSAQQPAQPDRAFLFVIDDVQLDFRSTPRTRDLLKRLLAILREGDVAAVVSSGYSSIAERPTSDKKRVATAIQQVTGGGLRPNEILAAVTPGGDDEELRRRSHVSLATSYDAFRNFARVRAGRRVVIFVSSGFPLPTDSREQLQDVIRVANDAGAPIYAFSVRDLVAQPLPQPDSDVWYRYVSDSRDTLRMLAAGTGGLMAVNETEFEYAVNQLAR